MKKNKKQLHEALAVLLTKLSSARENPLLMDNYVTKALRTVLLEFKKSGELYDAYKEQIQSTMESDNPWIGMLMCLSNRRRWAERFAPDRELVKLLIYGKNVEL